MRLAGEPGVPHPFAFAQRVADAVAQVALEAVWRAAAVVAD
jgi:hypothetical protein